MPNWCYNRVSVYSENTKDMDELFDIFNNENPFNALIPSPVWSETPNEDGELPVKIEHKNSKGEVLFVTMEFPKSKRNDDRWYDWNISNWGTKWDINGSVDIDVEDEDQIEINFNTAWGPPIEVCNKLRDMFPELGFSWFYDEPGMETAGYL